MPNCIACGLELVATGASCPRCGADADETRFLGSTEEPRPPTILAVESTAPGAPSAPLALDPEARYEVIEALGRGGMGIVYKVRDRALDELIALKILRPKLAGSDEAVARFTRELKLARRINHPNVARLYDLTLWRGRLAITQELISGRDLDSILADGPLPIETILRYLRYICSGLATAHDLGILHRDLKPGNIRIDEQDLPHILDFGLAALVDSVPSESHESLSGTPAYMAPEAMSSPHEVDRRSDVYSLGVVLFKMATGRVPFTAGATRELLAKVRQEAPPRPRSLRDEIPASLEEVILRCIEKEPDRRFASARDVYAHAAKALPGAGAEAHRSEPSHGGRPVDLLKPVKALVVDDDAGTRLLIRSILASLAVDAGSAGDGAQALAAVARERPDFILLDLGMPVLDGRETLRILKSDPASAAIPIVILTALEDSDEAAALRALGADAYLNKPVQADVLELLVEKYARRPASPI